MSNIIVKRILPEKTSSNVKDQLIKLAKKVKKSKGELDFQIRDDYLSIYYKGNSLAKVVIKKDGFIVRVHRNFKLKTAITNDKQKSFDPARVREPGGGNCYDEIRLSIDPKRNELRIFFKDEIINALATKIREVNRGEEITFEQSIITDNIDDENFIIIDRQVTGRGFPGTLDLLGLKKMESGKYRFVVLEVKLGNNHELEGDVKGQLDRYVNAIEGNFNEFKKCYEINYKQKMELGLFADHYPHSIEIENGVHGKILVGSYAGIAKIAIKLLKGKYPEIKDDVIEMFHKLDDKIKIA